MAGVVTSLTTSNGLVTAASGVSASGVTNKFFGVNSGGTQGYYTVSVDNAGNALTAINNEEVLTNTYTLSMADTWENTGLSITLPSAGRYLVQAEVLGRGVFDASAGALLARLYDVTDAAAVPHSTRTIVKADVETIALTLDNTGVSAAIYDVDAAQTIRLEAYWDGVLPTPAPTIRSNETEEGQTVLRYVKIANQIAAESPTPDTLTGQFTIWEPTFIGDASFAATTLEGTDTLYNPDVTGAATFDVTTEAVTLDAVASIWEPTVPELIDSAPITFSNGTRLKLQARLWKPSVSIGSSTGGAYMGPLGLTQP